MFPVINSPPASKMTINPIGKIADPNNVPNPEKFDGMGADTRI